MPEDFSPLQIFRSALQAAAVQGVAAIAPVRPGIQFPFAGYLGPHGPVGHLVSKVHFFKSGFSPEHIQPLAETWIQNANRATISYSRRILLIATRIYCDVSFQ